MRLVLIALVVFGCKSHDAAPRLTVDTVSEAEATAFATTLATLARPCDVATLAPLVDATALAAKFALGSAAADTAATARKLATSPTGVRVLCGWLEGTSSYTLVGTRTVDGQPRPIMRRLAVHPESGAVFVNYDQLHVGKSRADGTVRLVDAFSYRQGTWISELLLANLDAPKLDYLGPTSAPAEVRAARELVRTGERAAAVAALDALPASARGERAVQLLRVQAAAGISPDAYAEALDALAKAFPDDPVIALTQLDGARDRDDSAAMLRWLAVLDQAVGPDAYLDSTRAIVHVRADELDQALASANAAVAREPSYTRALEVKLDVLIAREDWDGVLAAMTQLEQDHGMAFDEAKLRTEPRLAGLVATPAFTQWLASR